MNGYLTTHVLDTARGVPAAGIEIELFRPDDGPRTPIVSVMTNRDGRTDAPLLPKGALQRGIYELVFHAGPYFERTMGPVEGPRFLDRIPIRFGVDDPDAHYHVPLLLSPFGYSTYRGS